MSSKVTVLTTMYYSSQYIEEFYFRVLKALVNISDNFEIIFVNDGSPDDSLEKVLSLREKDKRIKIINLSRNFGHHQAILSGLKYTTGDYIFLIDLDLEEPPELITSFWNKINSDKKIDVVYGVQKKRKGNYLERVLGNIFYKLHKTLIDIDYPSDTTTARLMKKEYVNSVLLYKEKELDLWTIFVLAGFNQVSLPVVKYSKGTTTYTFFKKIKISLNIITSTTSKPLYYVFIFGFIVTFLSIIYIPYVLFTKFFFNDIIEGWTSLAISIWFLGGVAILSIGVLGIYLSKIFKEIKNRPLSIIKKIYK